MKWPFSFSTMLFGPFLFLPLYESRMTQQIGKRPKGVKSCACVYREHSFLNGESPPWWSQKRQYAKFPPKSRMFYASTHCYGFVGGQAKSESWPRGPQAAEGICRISIPPFPGGEAQEQTPWLLAAELSKTGLKHGPLGEERGQAIHPQKRGGAFSHEHSEFMTFRDRSGLGGQKIPGVHGVGRQKPWAM